MRCPKCEFENPAGLKFCGKMDSELFRQDSGIGYPRTAA